MEFHPAFLAAKPFQQIFNHYVCVSDLLFNGINHFIAFFAKAALLFLQKVSQEEELTKTASGSRISWETIVKSWSFIQLEIRHLFITLLIFGNVKRMETVPCCFFISRL